MFDHKHYVPVLKGKRAEFPALGELHSKNDVTPLLESVPDQAPECVPNRMSAIWPQDKPFFIDLLFLDDEDMEDGAAGEHAIQGCFSAVANHRLHAIPVTGTGRSPAYQEAIRQIVNNQNRGFAIRLVSEDFDDADELQTAIEAIIELVGVPPSDIDMMIDAGTVANMGQGAVAQMHRASLSMIPAIDDWRTLTVISGAFPMSLAPLNAGAWNLVPRTDWAAWRSLIIGQHRPNRLPAYGDYAISHPDLPPGGRATILGQLRYATPNSFLIWKGYNVFKHQNGYNQFFDICQAMVARPEYRGQAFSFGDAEISAKAANQGSSGNAETWRKIGVNHHIETVIDQIANLPSS